MARDKARLPEQYQLDGRYDYEERRGRTIDSCILNKAASSDDASTLIFVGWFMVLRKRLGSSANGQNRSRVTGICLPREEISLQRAQDLRKTTDADDPLVVRDED